MQQLLSQLQTRFPNIAFTQGARFYWSPESHEVVYNINAKGQDALWALLHETSHALLEHRTYTNDFELLKMEVAAWEKAKDLAQTLQVSPIDENHVEDCLDTYRDWLHRRCLCPKCGNRSFQKDSQHYSCHNCSTTWKVTPSRFCRAYRAIESIAEN